MSTHRLARFTLIDRAEVAREIADLLIMRLPRSVPRTVVCQLLKFLEAILPGMFGTETKRLSEEPTIESPANAQSSEHSQGA